MRILWAVDPFEEAAGLKSSQVQAVKTWSELSGARIHPVHVFSAREFNMSVEFAPILADQYKPAAEQALRTFVQQAGLANSEPPRILVSESASRTHAVDRLVEEAHSIDADLVIAGTHGRTGVDRWLLGSFTETLLFRCDLPMLVVSTGGEPPRVPRHILFPTDLEEGSRAIFEQAVKIASDWNAELVLYHSTPNPVEPILQSAVFLLGGAWTTVHPYFSEDMTKRRERAESWAEWARSKGVRTRVKVEETNGQISQFILDHASRDPIDLILMAARSGRMESFLIGSVARQVVRGAHVPVLVLHERKLLSRSAA